MSKVRKFIIGSHISGGCWISGLDDKRDVFTITDRRSQALQFSSEISAAQWARLAATAGIGFVLEDHYITEL